MFIFHILVYIAFACVMYSLGKKSEDSYGDSQKIDRYLWWYIAFFTIICALRGRTGVDTLSYVNIFKKGFFINQLELVNGEWLFYYLSKFIVNHGLHYVFGLGICAFVQIYFTAKGLLPHRYLLAYFPIILFGGNLFLGECNAVRQMMAACIFFYSVTFIIDRKPLYFCVLIFLASLIHHSAIILLLCYFIPYRFDISQKRTWLLVIYITCFIIGFSPQFQNLVSYFESLIPYVGYDRYIETVSDILNTGYTKETRAFGPMQLSYFLSGLAIIWFGPSISERYSDSIPTLRLWYILAVAYGCLYFLLCNVSHLMIRPIMYIQLFQTVILTLILYDLFKQNRIQIGRLMLIVIWVSICWDIIKNTGAPNECVSYKLFFL